MKIPGSGFWTATTMMVALLSGLGMPEARAADAIVFGTNWKAQAEHGGFYQAVATGLYARHGLDVTIRQGGPNVNHRQLLLAGRVDFSMGGNMYGAFNAVRNRVPIVAVAAIFQKDPQVLLAHPGRGIARIEDLAGRPILVSKDGQLTYWSWLKRKYAFVDSQLRSYTFNLGPFLAHEDWAQQGYITAEPFAIERAGGFTPVVFLLADAGYDSYSTTIETQWSTVKSRPDLVQRFVDASIEGWYGYLYGDPSPADALILRDNPDMTTAQLAYSRSKLVAYGIVDSGDAETLGIGAMRHARWQGFLKEAVAAGLYPADLPVGDAYTLDFVNRGVGLDVRKRLRSARPKTE